MKKYKIIKGYQEKEELRNSFNQLAGKTFGLDFEPWYQRGYWTDNYIPYSILDGNKVVANVSVNPMKFKYGEEEMNVIQLGTVMTAEAYRRKGLIRRLMEEIEKDYGDRVQGSFLYANQTVTEFYPQFGYRKSEEYEYFRENLALQGNCVSQEERVSQEIPIFTQAHGAAAQKVELQEEENRSRLETAIQNSQPQSCLWQQDNLALVMFYVDGFLSDQVYELKNQNAFVIAEIQDKTLYLQGVFAPQKLDMEEIIAAFGEEIQRTVLGFVPWDTAGYQVERTGAGEDTLFLKGACLKMMEERNCLRFPVLSHT